jgi:dethiobiotin synthetase
MGPLVIISATGTEMGKTHVGEAFLLAHAPRPMAAYKPIETGVAEGSAGEDDTRLLRRATFHVKQRYTFVPPVSPHRAAAEAGERIDPALILEDAARARCRSPLLLELPGGLYSPVTLELRNADLVTALAPTLHVLLAPNRLGVLHDVLVTLAAYPRIDAVVLTPALTVDRSQSTNAGDLAELGAPCLGALPRGTPEELAHHPILRALVARLSSI